ncbi:hypothetical protein BON30_14200 [Cystobacter ferrugineus]|uniref:Lipoprotein n=2 Tax=Cystobacter ferrugineus TaxID=83449 RepID=A0A1L9BD54_9BACT|nr:hypothetical protein BON30_14200 [Cystobacter ferrugineus]
MNPLFRSSLSAALLTGMCACVTSSASRKPIPEGAVVLRFAWPEKLSARVTHTLHISGSQGLRTYWWSLWPGPEEGQRRLLVRAEAGTSQSALSAMADPESSLIFDAQGDFVSHETHEESESLGLLNALPLSAEQAAGIREQMEAAREDVARERWMQRVGRWRDVMLVPGETVRTRTRMWVGQNAFEREEMEAEERITIETGVACSPDDPEKNCVRVLTVTEPLHAYRESDPCERARAIKRFELVTDPRTLLPYLTRSMREDQMDSCRDDGTVHTREMHQGEEFVFTYGVEPVPQGTYSRR